MDQSGDKAAMNQRNATYRFWAAKTPQFAELFTEDYSYNHCISLMGNMLKDKDLLLANCRQQPQVTRHWAGTSVH